MAIKKKTPDWEVIGKEYRAGLLAIREIGRRHSISEAAIRKKANQEGWKRDLTQEVRSKVRENLVRNQVRTPNATDEEIVAEAAEIGVQVVESHRRDINQGRAMVSLLMGQLRDAANSRAEIEETIEATEEDIKRRNQLLRAVALPSHAAVVRDLSTAMKNLIALERQAFNLTDKAEDLSGRRLVVLDDDED